MVPTRLATAVSSPTMGVRPGGDNATPRELPNTDSENISAIDRANRKQKNSIASAVRKREFVIQRNMP